MTHVSVWVSSNGESVAPDLWIQQEVVQTQSVFLKFKQMLEYQSKVNRNIRAVISLASFYVLL